MSSTIDALTRGVNGLVLGYTTVLIAMLCGLRKARAPLSAWLKSPFVAIAATMAAGIVLMLADPMILTLRVERGGSLEFLIGMLLTVAVGYLTGRWLAARSGPDTQYRRGAVVTNAEPTKTKLQTKAETNPPVTLAGIPVPLADEMKHFKLIGTTGTGKSTAIRELLGAALARGDRAIIADPDGGYLDTFYDADRGDVILNPFALNSAKWSPFAEITNDYDVDQLARSLIPESGDTEPIWSEYARTLFTAVVQQCVSGGIRDDNELDRLLTQSSAKELRMLLGGTYAGPFLEEGADKMFGCVRSVTSSALRALRYITRLEGPPFSVRAWVRDGASRFEGGKGGVLFLPYRAGEIAALRSMISAWMRIAIFEAMNKPEGDHRLWFAIDELDALGAIDGLKDALARLRKFGGRSVLGLQSIAQVSTTHGKGTADTIVENCGNTVIFRCSASEHGGTSEFASKLIGQREVLHITRSRTRRPGDWFVSRTTSEQIRIEPAVMSSEIERLPDLEGYLKMSSTPDWRQVKFVPRPIALGRPSFFIPSAPPPPPAEGPPGFGVVPDTGPAPLPPTPTSSGAPKRRVPGKRVRKQAGSSPNASA